MNIENILSPGDNQTPGPQTAGTPLPDDGAGTRFNQILIDLAAHIGRSENQDTVSLPQNQMDWLNVLMGIFGQPLTGDLEMPDPSGEASSPAQTLVSFSLTEVIAALQPLINQNIAPATTEQPSVSPLAPNAQSKKKPPHLDNMLDQDLLNQLLPMLTMSSSQPATSLPSPPSPSAPLNPSLSADALPAPSTPVSPNAPNAVSQPAPQAPPVPDSTPQPVPQSPAQQPNTPAVAPHQPSPTFDSALNNAEAGQPSMPDPVSSTSNQAEAPPPRIRAEYTRLQFGRAAASTPATGEDAPAVKPGAGTTTIPSAPTIPSIHTSPHPVSAANLPATEPVPGLPDIPALHQIVKSATLMKHEGKTAIRLNLQPESLGQLLVHLDVSDGNVSVRMLAETAHARALIQEHLPQLKEVFTAQGLKIDGMTVAVGGDSSAFDAPDNPAREGFQRTPSPPKVAPKSGHGDQAVAPQPIARRWSSPHRIDYHI